MKSSLVCSGKIGANKKRYVLYLFLLSVVDDCSQWMFHPMFIMTFHPLMHIVMMCCLSATAQCNQPSCACAGPSYSSSATESQPQSLPLSSHAILRDMFLSQHVTGIQASVFHCSEEQLCKLCLLVWRSVTHVLFETLNFVYCTMSSTEIVLPSIVNLLDHLQTVLLACVSQQGFRLHWV